MRFGFDHLSYSTTSMSRVKPNVLAKAGGSYKRQCRIMSRPALEFIHLQLPIRQCDKGV